MTSFIAAGGSGRSTSFIPAVPAAWSVTTIAFMIISPQPFVCLVEIRTFQAVMTEAKLLLPSDKHVLFPERIEAVVRLRHCDVQTAINEAMPGLKHNAAAQ